MRWRAGDIRARELAALRRAMTVATSDPALAAEFAQHNLDPAMALGDLCYVGYAEAVVARFGEPLPAFLRSLRRLLRQYRHDFAGALDDFAGALALDPDWAVDHALRRTGFCRRSVFVGGSLLTLTIALIWLIERAFDLKLISA